MAKSELVGVPVKHTQSSISHILCCSLGSQVCKLGPGRSRQECNNRDSTSLDMWKVKGLIRCMVTDPDRETAGAAPRSTFSLHRNQSCTQPCQDQILSPSTDFIMFRLLALKLLAMGLNLSLARSTAQYLAVMQSPRLAAPPLRYRIDWLMCVHASEFRLRVCSGD